MTAVEKIIALALPVIAGALIGGFIAIKTQLAAIATALPHICN